MSKRKLTIRDVAQEAGVSIATVSRVMSGHPNVSKKTLKKVSDVINRHKYAPSSMARGLDKGKTGVIGIIVPDISNPYYARLYCAADDEARDDDGAPEPLVQAILAEWDHRVLLPTAHPTIRVAPAGDPVPTSTPGPHGGNMDNKKIAAGSALYLPADPAE